MDEALFHKCSDQDVRSALLSNHTGYAAIEKAFNTNADQNLLETVFLIAICRQSVNKWQSKTLFLKKFDLRLSKVLTFSIAAYSMW